MVKLSKSAQQTAALFLAVPSLGNQLRTNNKHMLSKGELLLRKYLLIKYHWVKHQYNVRPDWLKYTTGNNLELDVYIPELNIGFEFNGAYHLTDKSQHERDLFKIDACKKHGVKLYIFSLQTLEAYARTRRHDVGKYEGWYNGLKEVLKDYRERFVNDKTVSIIRLPTVNTYRQRCWIKSKRTIRKIM
jgi:hypothetical protein